MKTDKKEAWFPLKLMLPLCIVVIAFFTFYISTPFGQTIIGLITGMVITAVLLFCAPLIIMMLLDKKRNNKSIDKSG